MIAFYDDSIRENSGVSIRRHLLGSELGLHQASGYRFAWTSDGPSRHPADVGDSIKPPAVTKPCPPTMPQAACVGRTCRSLGRLPVAQAGLES
jgi:hypothetical protein